MESDFSPDKGIEKINELTQAAEEFNRALAAFTNQVEIEQLLYQLKTPLPGQQN